MGRMTVICLVSGAGLFAASCATTPRSSGADLASWLESTRVQARVRAAARDTLGALLLLRGAARGTAAGAQRDLIHGHLGALDAEASVLADLAALSAAAGDSATARATFERLASECDAYAVLDSLERSPFYRSLAATSTAPDWLDRLRRARRTWRDSAFVTPYRDTLPVEERLAGVALVWAETRYSYVDLGGSHAPDWDSVFTSTLARVARPMDTWTYYQEIERMLFSLDDDHSDVARLPGPLRRHRTGLPLESRRVEGHVLITRVRSASLGALGVRPGQEVVAIDGFPPERYVAERLPPQLGFSTPQARDAHTFGWQLWLGERDSTLQVRLRDPEGTERVVPIRRGGWADDVRDSTVCARMLGEGIGYLALNSFSDPRAVALVDSALGGLRGLRGLIVDTRRNSGGSQEAGWRVISRFLKRRYVQTEQFSAAYVAIWRAWGGLPPQVPIPERILEPDRSMHLDCPLLWLIGPYTASAAEGVAAMAEQTGVATTVGERTFGSTGQPLLFPLPGGGLARVRTEEERFNDGRSYTRRGITPQVPIAVTADGLRAGRDEVLEGALALMRRRLTERSPH